MIKVTAYILWDHQDGYRTDKVYIDEKSAKIGLEEHYTEYWIISGYAKIEPIDAVSYFKKLSEYKEK